MPRGPGWRVAASNPRPPLVDDPRLRPAREMKLVLTSCAPEQLPRGKTTQVPEMAVLSRCCCGLASLQTGSLVIGISCLIWNLFMVGAVAGALHSKTNAYDVLWGKLDTKTYLHVAFIFSICQAISNILLLFGANEEKPFLLLQWLVVKTLSAIAFIVIVIMFKINQYGTAVPLTIIIYVLVHVYILLVVFSYYQTLREKSRLPKDRESTEMREVRQS